MSRRRGRISVCMATHNGAAYLGEQLRSILGQLAPDDEVVISDDSSTDATVAIIKAFADPRIRLYEHNTFFSPIFNFEHALQQATGEIIILADQDDVWLDNKVATIVEHLPARARVPWLLVLDGVVIDAGGRQIAASIFQKLGSGPGVVKNVYDNTYLGCCLAFSRDLLAIALPFPRTIPMHDMWLGLLCNLWGRVEFVPVKTIGYRKHPGSMTDFRIRFQPCVQIRRRFWLIWHLVVRSLRHWRRGKEGR